MRTHVGWRGEQNISVEISLYHTRTLGPEGGWIVRSHIGWRGE